MELRSLDACLHEYAQGNEGCQLILSPHHGGTIDRNRSNRNRINSKQHRTSPVSSILFLLNRYRQILRILSIALWHFVLQPHAYSSFSPVTVRTCVIASGERSSMICMKLICANLAARFRSKGTGLEGSTRA